MVGLASVIRINFCLCRLLNIMLQGLFYDFFFSNIFKILKCLASLQNSEIFLILRCLGRQVMIQCQMWQVQYQICVCRIIQSVDRKMLKFVPKGKSEDVSNLPSETLDPVNCYLRAVMSTT